MFGQRRLAFDQQHPRRRIDVNGAGTSIIVGPGAVLVFDANASKRPATASSTMSEKVLWFSPTARDMVSGSFSNGWESRSSSTVALPAVFDRRSTLSENGSPARTWSGATISTAGGETRPPLTSHLTSTIG